MKDMIRWDEIAQELSDIESIMKFLENSQKIISSERDEILERISTLVDINRVRAVLHRFVNIMVEKIGAEGVVCYYLDTVDGADKKEMILKPYYVTAPDKETKRIPALLNFKIPFDHRGGVLAYVLAERKTVFVQNLDKAHLVSESSRYFHELLPVKSHVTIPLFLDYTPVGALMFYTLSHPMDIENDLIEKIETDVYSIAMILKAIRLYEKVYRDYRYIKKIHLNFQKEIELAQKIQHNLIPEKFPGMPGIKVECWYQPMEELGGDFFDYIIRREGDGVGFFISDVAGHGVPSALITTMMKSLLSTYRVHHHKPSILFNRINRNLFENNVSSFFVTAFYLFLDIHKKKIAYSSAGHNEMILYRRRRESMEKMKTRGKFLGIFQDIEWEEKTASLENQDRILLYTDGITEMMSSKGEEFGIDRLMNLLHLSRNLDTVSTKNFLIRNILNYENKTLNNDDKAFILIDIL